MHTITVPESITLVDPDTGLPISGMAPLTFRQFVTKFISSHPIGIQSYENVISVREIIGALSNELNPESGEIVLTDLSLRMLREAVRQPSQIFSSGGTVSAIPGYGYHPAITQQLIPFLSAIME